MKSLLFFILFFSLTNNVLGQFESNAIKFKTIKPKTLAAKPTKNVSKPQTNTVINFPKIEAPNIFKETNIYGTKPKPNTSFAIGVTKNHFSMTPKNTFQHSLGEFYQEKMTKDLDKTMIREQLKEDNALLDRKDRYLGDYKTSANKLRVLYRDYNHVDGDLINVYVNNNLVQSKLYLGLQTNSFLIPLVKGINSIEFVVASQGTSLGNTAEIQVLDDSNNTITHEYWDNLALGTKIKLIVMKE